MADNFKLKDARARLNYCFKWCDWLEEGEQIDDFEITISPSGVLINEEAIETSGCVVVWLSGGTVLNTYEVTCTINSGSKIDDRTMYIQVVQR